MVSVTLSDPVVMLVAAVAIAAVIAALIWANKGAEPEEPDSEDKKLRAAKKLLKQQKKQAKSMNKKSKRGSLLTLADTINDSDVDAMEAVAEFLKRDQQAAKKKKKKQAPKAVERKVAEDTLAPVEDEDDESSGADYTLIGKKEKKDKKKGEKKAEEESTDGKRKKKKGKGGDQFFKYEIAKAMEPPKTAKAKKTGKSAAVPQPAGARSEGEKPVEVETARVKPYNAPRVTDSGLHAAPLDDLLSAFTAYSQPARLPVAREAPKKAPKIGKPTQPKTGKQENASIGSQPPQKKKAVVVHFNPKVNFFTQMKPRKWVYRTLEYLPAKDLVAFRSVSKEMKRMADSPDLWRELVKRDFGLDLPKGDASKDPAVIFRQQFGKA